ncbi:MAG: LysE family translocator [Actinobacteria bacterium]|nr:LysE family translocator [Actinomycetota bacterium]
MLQETNIALFLAASLALIVTPGQDNIYIVTRGIAQGRKAALFSAWGVCCGLVFHTTLAAVGLSALLAGSAVAFSVVKYAGAAYLVYLGIRTLLSKEEFAGSEEAAPVNSGSIFFQGVASNVLNPKVALFFLAFLPQFVSPDDGAALQFVVLGAIFALLALVVTSVVAYFSGTLGDWLRSKAGFATALRWFSGSALVGLGLRLALPERR